MTNFVTQEWKDYCARLMRSAAHYGAGDDSLVQDFEKQASEFADEHQVNDWPSLLKAIRIGQNLIAEWRKESSVVFSTRDSNEESRGRVKDAYVDSGHHGNISVPSTSMSEQAAEASASNSRV